MLFLFIAAFAAHAQWQNVHTFPNPAYSFITCNGNLYAGLGGGGVYTSQDSGITWTAVNNGIQFGGAYVFSLTEHNDSIYAGGFGEVSFTDNGGASWSLLNLNLWLNSYVYAVTVKDSYIFAGVGHDTSNGVYRKHVSGTAWTLMNSGLPANIGVNAFAVNGNDLFAGTDSGVYVSTSNGASWSWMSNGITQGLAVKALIILNGNIIAGTTNGIFFSSNGGSSWSSAAGLLPNSYVTSFTTDGATVVAGTHESAFYSGDNGANWIQISNGLGGTMSFFSLTSLGGYVFAGTGAGIASSNSVFRFAYSDVTAVEENSDAAEWTVFPNPFAGEATLRTSVPMKQATLTITNGVGQVVRQMSNLSGNTVVLSRNGLESGLYFVRLQNGGSVVTGRLVVAD